MPDGSEAQTTLTVRAVGAIDQIPAGDWDACAGPDNPFCRHAFLLALEDSRSVGGRSGWIPHHLVVEAGAGTVLAVAPLYVKGHSYGEYVFDWAWANAYHRAGGDYYPKLQCAIPFTPVTGPRLMVRPDLGETGISDRDLRQALVSGMLAIAKEHQLSSLHITFCTGQEADEMEQAGLIRRHGQQFHWQNRGYGSFDDFLGDLASRKRKTIRKEREKAQGHGVCLRTLSGAEMTSKHWDAFYKFYEDTADRKWGQAYLTRDFFHLLGATMPEAVVMMIGEVDGMPVCGALNLRGGDSLFGRNWGAIAEFKYLHFEVCYYMAIDYAIAHGLTWVEAGAQGAHKVQRGYLPRTTHSVHWLADPGFASAIRRYCAAEADALSEDMAEIADLGPFRKGPPGGG